MYKKRNLVNKSLIEDGQRVALKSFEMALGERELKRVSWSIPNTAMSNHPNKLNCKMVGAHSAFRSRCFFFTTVVVCLSLQKLCCCSDCGCLSVGCRWWSWPPRASRFLLWIWIIDVFCVCSIGSVYLVVRFDFSLLLFALNMAHQFEMCTCMKIHTMTDIHGLAMLNSFHWQNKYLYKWQK